MTPQFTAFIALTEELGLIPSTQMALPNHLLLHPALRDLIPSSVPYRNQARTGCTYTHAGNTRTHIK